jgi:AraC family transcriptional regulator
VKNDLTAIRKFVGVITKEQLRYVDCFVAGKIALFMPVGGPCFYALTPEHTHPAYMFVYHFTDQIDVLISGKKISGTPGKVFALSPLVPHQELSSDLPPRYIAMMISKPFFEKQYALYSGKKPAQFRGTLFEAGEGLPHLLKRFMIEADTRTAGTPVVLDALAIEICHSLIRGIVRTPAPKDRMADRVEVGRVIEYLHSHLDDKITVDVLADIAHLSPSHFNRVFREDIGKPPMEYVQDLRLERAKKLLLAGDKSVTAIALECGFGSTSYLSACFQKQNKMTPSEYQRGISR